MYVIIVWFKNCFTISCQKCFWSCWKYNFCTNYIKRSIILPIRLHFDRNAYFRLIFWLTVKCYCLVSVRWSGLCINFFSVWVNGLSTILTWFPFVNQKRVVHFSAVVHANYLMNLLRKHWCFDLFGPTRVHKQVRNYCFIGLVHAILRKSPIK